MDTIRKIMDLKREPNGTGDPRRKAMSHIHGVLNEQGPPQEWTVGHAVAAAIEGIRTLAGEHGAHRVDTVFRDRSLDDAYRTPLSSPYADAAHRQVASAELQYWQREAERRPSAATAAAVSFGLEQRVQLQKGLGHAVGMGQSFTDYLQQQQTSSTGQNPFAGYANNYMPAGTVQYTQSAGTSTQPTYQPTKPAAPKRTK